MLFEEAAQEDSNEAVRKVLKTDPQQKIQSRCEFSIFNNPSRSCLFDRIQVLEQTLQSAIEAWTGNSAKAVTVLFHLNSQLRKQGNCTRTSALVLALLNHLRKPHPYRTIKTRLALKVDTLV